MNQTEQFMTDTQHYWDKTGLPEADEVSYEERLKKGYEEELEDDPTVRKIWVP